MLRKSFVDLHACQKFLAFLMFVQAKPAFRLSFCHDVCCLLNVVRRGEQNRCSQALDGFAICLNHFCSFFDDEKAGG